MREVVRTFLIIISALMLMIPRGRNDWNEWLNFIVIVLNAIFLCMGV